MALIANALDCSPDTPARSQRVVIAREAWTRALNGFTQRHDRWLVALDVFPPHREPQRVFENLPLLDVWSDRLDHNGTRIMRSG